MRRRFLWIVPAIVVALGSVRTVASPPAKLTIPIASPRSIVASAGSIWVASSTRLFRIDPRSGAIELEVPLPFGGRSELTGPMLAYDGALWAVTVPIDVRPGSHPRAALWRLDARTGRAVGNPILLVGAVAGMDLVSMDGAIWLANGDHGRFGRLERVDPATRRLRAIEIPDAPASIVAAHRLLWVGEDDTGTIVRVDPRTDAVVRPSIRTGGALLTLAAGSARVWVADGYRHRLLALDPATGAIVVRRAAPGIVAVATGAGEVWAATGRALLRIDPRTGAATGPPARVSSYGTAVAGGGVWTIGPGGLTRISA